MASNPSFRPATDPERRACRMLLPESVGWAWAPKYLVAMEDSPRQLLATLAYAPTLQANGPAWFVALHVIRTHRRQRIGTRLLEVLIDHARSTGILSLVSQVDSSSDAETAAFLQRADFHRVRTLTTFEGVIDLDHWESGFRPIYHKLEARGKIPPNLRVISLREAPLDQVSRLYAKNLGGTPGSVEIFLRNALAHGSLAPSFTLMLGERVVGLYLLDVHEASVEIHAKIVDQEFRMSWANILLTRELVSRLRVNGKRRVRFVAFDNVHYTMMFAERYGVGIVKAATQFIRKIQSPVV